MRPPQRLPRYGNYFILAFIVTPCIYAIYIWWHGFVTSLMLDDSIDDDKAADVFAGFVSALAFVGLILTLYYQIREFREQRNLLGLQVEQLEKQFHAMESASRLTALTSHLNRIKSGVETYMRGGQMNLSDEELDQKSLEELKTAVRENMNLTDDHRKRIHKLIDEWGDRLVELGRVEEDLARASEDELSPAVLEDIRNALDIEGRKLTYSQRRSLGRLIDEWRKYLDRLARSGPSMAQVPEYLTNDKTLRDLRAAVGNNISLTADHKYRIRELIREWGLRDTDDPKKKPS